MIYFKFNEGKFQIDKKEKKSLWHIFIKHMFFFIPDSNPDLEANSERISTWYIEYDDVEYNLPIKEFGIDVNGKILFLAPSKKNYGYWCDLDANIDFYQKKFNITYISAEEFYSYWNSFSKE